MSVYVIFAPSSVSIFAIVQLFHFFQSLEKGCKGKTMFPGIRYAPG